MTKIELSVEESLKHARGTAHWDGFVAGARAAAEHAKAALIHDIIGARKPTPPPVQTEPPKE